MFPGVVSIRVVVRRSEHTSPSTILLLKDAEGRFAGQWRLPGGEYRGVQHTCEASAAIILFQETEFTVRPKDLRLQFVAGEPHRDPSQRDLAMVYRVDFREHWTFLNNPRHAQQEVTFRWVPQSEILLNTFGPIALDHSSLVRRAITGFSI